LTNEPQNVISRSSSAFQTSLQYKSFGSPLRRSHLPCFPAGCHPGSSATVPAASLAAAPSPGARPRSPSSLSPDARPFFPSGRSKSQRWEDSSLVVSSADVTSPLRASFHDVLLSQPTQAESEPKPVEVAPPRPALCSVVGHCSVRPPWADSDGWVKVESRCARRCRLSQARRCPH
jgi:hypothetical protein